MPRPAKGGNRHRLTLDLSDKSMEQLEFLLKETDVDTRVEVVREALKLYDFVCRAKKAGSQLYTKTGDVNQEIIILT